MAVQNGHRARGRNAPPEKAAQLTIDLGAKQRQIIAQLQADEGRAAQLRKELKLVEERIVARRGQLDLLVELAQEGHSTAAPALPPEINA